MIVLLIEITEKSALPETLQNALQAIEYRINIHHTTRLENE